MRIVSAIGLGLASVLTMLLGTVAVGCALSVRITPFSWNFYWRSTAYEWFIALIYLPIGFAIFRQAVRL